MSLLSENACIREEILQLLRAEPEIAFKMKSLRKDTMKSYKLSYPKSVDRKRAFSDSIQKLLTENLIVVDSNNVIRLVKISNDNHDGCIPKTEIRNEVGDDVPILAGFSNIMYGSKEKFASVTLKQLMSFITISGESEFTYDLNETLDKCSSDCSYQTVAFPREMCEVDLSTTSATITAAELNMKSNVFYYSFAMNEQLECTFSSFFISSDDVLNVVHFTSTRNQAYHPVNALNVQRILEFVLSFRKTETADLKAMAIKDYRTLFVLYRDNNRMLQRDRLHAPQRFVDENGLPYQFTSKEIEDVETNGTGDTIGRVESGADVMHTAMCRLYEQQFRMKTVVEVSEIPDLNLRHKAKQVESAVLKIAMKLETGERKRKHGAMSMNGACLNSTSSTSCKTSKVVVPEAVSGTVDFSALLRPFAEVKANKGYEKVGIAKASEKDMQIRREQWEWEEYHRVVNAARRTYLLPMTTIPTEVEVKHVSIVPVDVTDKPRVCLLPSLLDSPVEYRDEMFIEGLHTSNLTLFHQHIQLNFDSISTAGDDDENYCGDEVENMDDVVNAVALITSSSTVTDLMVTTAVSAVSAVSDDSVRLNEESTQNVVSSAVKMKPIFDSNSTIVLAPSFVDAGEGVMSTASFDLIECDDDEEEEMRLALLMSMGDCNEGCVIMS